MYCSKCGKELKDDARFCNNCGNSLTGNTSANVNVVSVGNHEKPDVGSLTMEQIAEKAKQPQIDEKYCFSCGSIIKKIAEICPKCGVKQMGVPSFQGEKKNNIVFFVLTIFFTVVGMALYIFSYCYTEIKYKEYVKRYDAIRSSWGNISTDEYLQRNNAFWNGASLVRHRDYATFSAIASGLIAIGIIFSIISLYRKQNKMYFWFAISPCILIALWNGFVWFTRYF